MKKYLIVKADTNDADYVTEIRQINDKTLEEFKPLIQAIKEFKPFKDNQYNFPTNQQVRDDMGQQSAREIYKEIVSEDVFEYFIDEYVPSSEYGIHTIKSIKLWEVVSEENLLV